MTNPFTAFAFEASGSGVTTAITLPARLAYVKNVKDFGAKGDGVTDDWAAIMATFNWTSSNDRGTIYFPPGTYLVSQPIDLTGSGNASVRWVGDLTSTIKGNFSDFVFKILQTSFLLSTMSKLTITNTNATGGGIRVVGGTNAAFRDLVITANMGMDTTGNDTPPYQGFQDCTIENCAFTPGPGNSANSFGLFQVANGPILNCSFNGFSIGISMVGAEAAQSPVSGCFFQNCGVGIQLGLAPNNDSFSNNFVLIAGCWFKNNSIAINFSAAGSSASWGTFAGLRIEGTNGQAPGGTNPQYGIIINTQKASQDLFAGVIVTGQYDQAGIYIAGATGTSQNNTFMGAQVSNSGSGAPWLLGAPEYDQFYACNVANVFTVAQIGTAGPEGSLYNVSDGTNSLAWGATLTNTGTHATHYKVRSNGSNWTVVGQ